MVKPKLFIVEDDDNIRDLVAYVLESSGFDAVVFSSSKLMYEELKNQLPDLFLLDIMLPDDDGLLILKHLKESANTKDIPVIMLTAKDSEYDKVTGLNSGADDYIAKPFSVLELVARIKAVLRRSGGCDGSNDTVTYKNIELCLQKRLVSVDDTKVSLTYKEFEILYLLMKNLGIVLSREQILSTIWENTYEVETRTVDMHIKSIRKKLGDAGENIVTVRSIGYKIGD